MALGVPVVTTPISGIPELVTDGDSGLLCKPGSVGALADALQRICTDHALADALAARGRAVVHERLDVDRIAAELVRRIEA
jgi:glycosyltransferase involved in cell wall biosynthesis